MLFMSYHTHTFYDLEVRERLEKKEMGVRGPPKKGAQGGPDTVKPRCLEEGERNQERRTKEKGEITTSGLAVAAAAAPPPFKRRAVCVCVCVCV